MAAPRTLCVGIGSSHGDDRAGWLVAEALERHVSGQVEVRQAGAPLDLLNWLDGVDRLLLCDACQGLELELEPDAGADPESSRAPAGTWRSWRWPVPEFPAARARHSHDLGLPAVLQLATQLGQLPAEVLVWGIEIRDTGPERPPSAAVVAAVPEVAAHMARMLGVASHG